MQKFLHDKEVKLHVNKTAIKFIIILNPNDMNWRNSKNVKAETSSS